MALSSPSEGGYGLIILGNSGVGKSFLANILLGREVFVHRFAARAVTTQTEFEEIRMGNEAYAIFDIPGLIEANQDRIELNKIEIGKAFDMRPKSLILYVFGQQGGRIRDEDVVAFNALNQAYPFESDSLLLIINAVAKDRPQDYEGEVTVLLEQLIEASYPNICVLDAIDKSNRHERSTLKNKLLQIIVELTPHDHFKKQNIDLEREDVRQAKEEIKVLQTQFQANKQMYEKEIKQQQAAYNNMFTKIRNENEQMQLLVQRQAEIARQLQNRIHTQEITYKKEQEQLKTDHLATIRQMETKHNKAIQDIQRKLKQAQPTQSDASKNTTLRAQKKAAYCFGNACSQCDRCRDWHYNGDFERDVQRWIRSKSMDVRDAKRWHRRSNATCDLFDVGFVDRVLDYVRSSDALFSVNDQECRAIVQAATGRNSLCSLVKAGASKRSGPPLALDRYGILSDEPTSRVTQRFRTTTTTTTRSTRVRLHRICCCD